MHNEHNHTKKRGPGRGRVAFYGKSQPLHYGVIGKDENGDQIWGTIPNNSSALAIQRELQNAGRATNEAYVQHPLRRVGRVAETSEQVAPGSYIPHPNREQRRVHLQTKRSEGSSSVPPAVGTHWTSDGVSVFIAVEGSTLSQTPGDQGYAIRRAYNETDYPTWAQQQKVEGNRSVSLNDIFTSSSRERR